MFYTRQSRIIIVAALWLVIAGIVITTIVLLWPEWRARAARTSGDVRPEERPDASGEADTLISNESGPTITRHEHYVVNAAGSPARGKKRAAVPVPR